MRGAGRSIAAMALAAAAAAFAACEPPRSFYGGVYSHGNEYTQRRSRQTPAKIAKRKAQKKARKITKRKQK